MMLASHLFTAICIASLSLFSFLKAQPLPSFVSPIDGSTYPTGSSVPVKISYPLDVGGVFSASCGTGSSFTTNQAFSFNINTGFVGNCTLSAKMPFPSVLDPLPIVIKSVGTVTFQLPATGISVAAGTSVGVILSYSPIGSTGYNFDVTLDCSSSGQAPFTMSVPGGLSTPTPFPVPSTFYGPCRMTVFDPNGLYRATNSVNLEVTQTLNIAKPTSGQVISYPDPFEVLVQTTASNIFVSVEMNMTCFLGVSRFFNVTTNKPSMITPLTSDFGTCTLRVSRVPVSYLVIPTSTRTFSIKITVEFDSYPSTMFSGVDAPLLIVPTAPVDPGLIFIFLNLNCSGSVLAEFPAYINGSTSSIYISPPVSNRNDCAISTRPQSPLFFFATTPKIQVLNPSLILPVDGGFYSNMEEVFVNLANGTLYDSASVTQICGNSSVTQTLNSSAQGSFTIPPNYIGTCTYSAATDRASIISNVTINVLDRVVGFVRPVADPTLTIFAGSPIPIQLAYSPRSPENLQFLVKLQCSDDSKTELITGNTDGLSIDTPDTFYGTPCNLTIIEPPAGFTVVNNRSVNVLQSLTLTSPVPDQDIIVSEPTPFFLSTSAASLPKQSITVTFKCPRKTATFTFNTNQLYFESFDASYIGKCNVSITNAPNFYVRQSPFSVNVKFGLEFVTSPPLIIGNLPFNFELKSSSIPPTTIPKVVNIYLICKNNEVVYTWFNNPINALFQLTLPAEIQIQEQCRFSTGEDDPYYFEATAPVDVIRSPFGGFVYPITGDETSNFAKSVTFTSPAIGRDNLLIDGESTIN